jgi:hypothetical protein
MTLTPQTLEGMGQRGRAWMERDFGWASIAMRMESAYRWIQDGGTCPEWVRES